MTTEPASGSASPSGVRRSGDHFQDVFVWSAAMQLIRPRPDYFQIETEQRGQGNVDDLVLRSLRPDLPDRYTQVKWAVNTADLLDEDYLLAARPRGQSLLQKFHTSYRLLTRDGQPPAMRLITNRSPDSNHPLLGHIDGRTELLLPATDTRSSAVALQAWQEHLGIDLEELTGLLTHLQFRLGQGLVAEREHARELMLTAGLHHTEEALESGLSIVAKWIRDGRRALSRPDVLDATADLLRSDPAAILTVQAIDSDPRADEATIALYFLHLFSGDTAPTRILPRDPAGWLQMEADIVRAAAALERDTPGRRTTLLRGAMRQATFFRVGASLPDTRGHIINYFQRGELWSTATTPLLNPRLRTATTLIGTGSGLAVAVGMTLDPTPDVVSSLRSSTKDVGELLTITSEEMGPFAVPHAAAAVGVAVAVRDIVRQRLRDGAPVDRIHLFLAGPGGLALLLGHRWNRMPRTVVYEHAGIQTGYEPAFDFTA